MMTFSYSFFSSYFLTFLFSNI